MSRMSTDDLLVHYMAHLVRICWRRCSFYVSLGICRLLHDYSTAEARSITDVITQNPDRLRDDVSYRQAKRLLMRELQHHFGSLLETHRVARGELRFRCRRPTDHERSLVQTYLELLTPWQTSCPIPESFDPTYDVLPALFFDGGRPDDEHSVEMRRIHSVLHPTCYARTAQALGLDAPGDRLLLPCFKRRLTDQQPHSTQLDATRSLSREEHSMIDVALDHLAQRRRRWATHSATHR